GGAGQPPPCPEHTGRALRQAIPKVRKPKRLPRPFQPDERDRLMALPLAGQDKILRLVLYYTGLRITPIMTLRVDQISFAEAVIAGIKVSGTIRTVAKGNRPQVSFIHEALRGPLLEHVLGKQPYE